MDRLTCANVNAVAEVLVEIERQKKSRRDYIYPAAKLQMDPAGRIVFAGSQTFQVGDRVYTEWADAESAADATGAPVVPLGQSGALPLNRTAERQLADRLDIPLKYIDRLRGAEHGDLAAHNVSTLLGRTDARFLVRTLDGQVRAVLSDRYRVLDNADVFFAAADMLQAAEADVWNARLWHDGFELFAVSRAITGAVQAQLDQARGQHQWATIDDGGDLHNAAVRISNSETGCGGLSVHFALLRQVCNNTAVVGKALSVIHLGRRNEAEGLVYSAETQEAESRAIWLKLRDAIRTAFDRQRFADYLARLNGLTAQPLAAPETAVENVVREFQLPEARKAQILRSLFEGRDLSRFGLVQAVTAQAHDAPAEDASRFEEVGGALVDMADNRFAALARS
jgi:hypothetical protein